MVLPAYVDAYGAIVFPNNICIDGHHALCLHRIVTHIHADHTLALDKSIASSKNIIATPLTLEMLSVLGHNIPTFKALALDYGKPMKIAENAVLKLAMAKHIPGSAQVVYEDDDGVIVYTSDFRSPGRGTEIIDSDILVIDATYGDPRFVRENEDVLWSKFLEMLRKLMTLGPVSLYAYYGKAQEVMIKLREEGIDAPFILSLTHWKLYTALSKYGYRVSDVFQYGDSEAQEVLRSGWYIEVHHTSRFNSMRRERNKNHILLTGRYAKTILNSDNNTWIVGISGHADFNELVHYVDEARPRLLIVDGYRSTYAYKFASYVKENMGIEAIVTPVDVSIVSVSSSI